MYLAVPHLISKQRIAEFCAAPVKEIYCQLLPRVQGDSIVEWRLITSVPLIAHLQVLELNTRQLCFASENQRFVMESWSHGVIQLLPQKF